MHYVVMLPLDPSPDKYHIWTQEELDTCCGTVKVLYKNESVDVCTNWLAIFRVVLRGYDHGAKLKK